MAMRLSDHGGHESAVLALVNQRFDELRAELAPLMKFAALMLEEYEDHAEARKEHEGRDKEPEPDKIAPPKEEGLQPV